MKALFNNPLGLCVIAIVLLMVAAIDIQYVDAGPDNWFAALHWYGKLAVIGMMAALAWLIIQYLIWPVLRWIFKRREFDRSFGPIGIEAGTFIPTRRAAKGLSILPFFAIWFYSGQPYRYMVTFMWITFHVSIKFYRNR